VIPVAVTGMYDVKRKGSWLIRPGQQITVHICAPIPTKGLSDEEVADLALRVQQITAGHVDAQLAEADA
jgi:1-acyl-sn-glycerol-3-phosphate acyltransferase